MMLYNALALIMHMALARSLLLLYYKLCVHTMLVVCTLRFTWHASVVWFKCILFLS